MRVANCKTVCCEIEEADSGQRLSASVTEHLGSCPQCQTFHDERSKLRQLVASLETVATPPDFDFRVRSRLANEKASAHAGFFFRNFSFGFPSIALATLVLMIGGVLALRAWNAPTNSATVLQTETRDVNPPNIKSEQSPLAGKSELTKSELTLPDKKSTADATRDEGNETLRPVQGVAKRSSLKSTVASVRSSRRMATKDFSSTSAPVVKREEAVASLESSPIFPIETSSQPLRLSLDYSGGISRTISVPALSFGSERVLAGGGLSLVKNSPKGAW
ncbi:MAG TPA: hypothetical protein VES69_15395 [Pyrinomonadaceae bacterium]|nr:hypothetical protein [Pyrinomonadaceae bacterium]